MVDADAVAHQSRQRATEPGDEAKLPDGFANGLFLRFGAHVGAHEGLSPLDRAGLGEVDDVDGRLAACQQVVDCRVHRRVTVGVVKGHWTVVGVNHRGRPPVRRTRSAWKRRTSPKWPTSK